jgi:hypothetical protein
MPKGATIEPFHPDMPGRPALSTPIASDTTYKERKREPLRLPNRLQTYSTDSSDQYCGFEPSPDPAKPARTFRELPPDSATHTPDTQGSQALLAIDPQALSPDPTDLWTSRPDTPLQSVLTLQGPLDCHPYSESPETTPAQTMFTAMRSAFGGGANPGGHAMMAVQMELQQLKSAPILNPHFGMVTK